MTIETTLIILGFCLFACYLVFEWQKAAIPPYQEPVEYSQDDGALTPAQIEQIKDSLEPTPLNPQAAWPFPHGRKP
jgi:hypothetical protein